MSEVTRSAESSADREIFCTRLYDAPRDLVWRLWTEPEHIAQWWGPDGFRNTIHEMNVRPGGDWRFIMHGPDGRDYPNHNVYVEVVRPERLVYEHVSPPKHRVTTIFDEEGGKTRVSMRMVFETAELREQVAKKFGAVEGQKQTMARLAEHLANIGPAGGDEAFVLSRTFDAPRELVYEAWTDADRLRQWFGPKGFSVVANKLDLRPGGIYHYGLRSPDGHEVWGKWIFRAITPPERLEFVSCFSDAQGGTTRHPFNPEWPRETLSVITFEEHAGRTTVTVRWSPLNATETERKTFAANHESMQKGWGGTMEQFEAYLATAKRTS